MDSYTTRPLRTPGPVVVEYTSQSQRVCKHFTNAFAARRFYASKLKAGQNPRVLKPVEEQP